MLFHKTKIVQNTCDWNDNYWKFLRFNEIFIASNKYIHNDEFYISNWSLTYLKFLNNKLLFRPIEKWTIYKFFNIWFCLKIYRCLIPLLKKWWKSYCPSVQSRRPPISVLSSVSGFCRYVAISCLWNIRLLRIYKKDSVKLKTILKCELNYHNSIFHLNKFQSKSDLIYKFYNLYGFFPLRVIESMY